MILTIRKFSVFVLVAVLAMAGMALAADDEALHLTMNKDELVRLDQDAASVIVNNPAHAEVTLDSPRLLIVMPRAPGATSFTVLNAKGAVILTRDIIVSGTQAPRHVRVRRICQGNDASCVPSAYYYCPDGCYEITPVGQAGPQAGGAPAPAPQGAAAGAAQEMTGAASGMATGAGTPAAGVAPALPSLPALPPAAEAPPPLGPDNEPLTTPGQKP